MEDDDVHTIYQIRGLEIVNEYFIWLWHTYTSLISIMFKASKGLSRLCIRYLPEIVKAGASG